MSEVTPIPTTAQAASVDNPDGGVDSTRGDEVIEPKVTTSDAQFADGDTVDPEGGTPSGRLEKLMRGHQAKSQCPPQYAEDASGENIRVQK